MMGAMHELGKNIGIRVDHVLDKNTFIPLLCALGIITEIHAGEATGRS